MGSRNKKEQQKFAIPKQNAPNMNNPHSIPSFFPIKSHQEIQSLNKEKIYFSFRYLDFEHEAFNCGNTKSNWYIQLFNNLTEVSKLTYQEFEQQRNHYDLHGHDFEKTNFHYVENNKLNDKILSQISPENLIQFRISTAKGRVHGIRYHNKIYVVWFDPHHNMNNSDGHGGVNYYDRFLTPYELLHLESEEKDKKIRLLEEEIEIYEEMIKGM